MVDHILKKWPDAELSMQSSMLLHDNELIITHANQWFITMSHSFGKVSAIIYMVTGSAKNNDQGYKYLKEYQVNIPQKQGRYQTCYINHLGASRLVNICWSVAELIGNMEMEMTKSIAKTGQNKAKRKYNGLRPIL